ncbi:MAG: 6-bladed beta-propeller [Gammaproteobacteria bacterium]|nr:6-bladed beta-propeller [Gammaproteobacteria bacterium]
MPVKRLRPVLLCVWVSLAACASVPQQMRYFDPQAGGVMVVWPAAPETPRYRFAGELVGAPNFFAAQENDPGVAMNVLRWVAGIGRAAEDSSRSLLRPQSGMVDATGRIYVTDSGRQAVFVFDETAGELSIWKRADAGDDLATPVGIAPGADTEILVADSTLARIVRLSADGVPLGSFGAGQLGRPTGLARDRAGRVFVADSGEHDVKVFDLEGRLLKRIGRRGSAAGEFNAPTHLAVSADRLYVTDTLNARVQSLTLEGEPLSSYGRRGLYLGNLIRPKGVAVDSDDNLYVVESFFDHLLVFGDDGTFLLPIGGPGSAAGRFFLPAGAWSDTRGRIFVADMFNARVTIFLRLGEDV